MSFQVNGVRLDDLRITKKEDLTFYYTSWSVGLSAGSIVTAFTTTDDVPYFSGQYDQYKYAVAHKAASLAFYGPLRSQPLGVLHEAEAIKAKDRVKKLIPVSVTKESPNFKVKGIRFGKHKAHR